jgi:hypothetical protein
MGAKSLCIAQMRPEEGVEGLKCIQCCKKATVWGLFGRSEYWFLSVADCL